MYTGHALDIEGFITIGDIIIALAWCVPYMDQKEKNMILRKLKFLFNG